MRLATCAMLILCASSAPAPAFDSAEYDLAVRTILCDCGCHPQTVKDCACGRAAEMREEIARKIAGGGPQGAAMTGKQVIDAYVAEFGEKIRIAPVATGFNLLAWLGPLFVLVFATVALWLVLRRLAARQPPLEPAPATPVAGDDRYRERLRRELERFE